MNTFYQSILLIRSTYSLHIPNQHTIILVEVVTYPHKYQFIRWTIHTKNKYFESSGINIREVVLISCVLSIFSQYEDIYDRRIWNLLLHDFPCMCARSSGSLLPRFWLCPFWRSANWKRLIWRISTNSRVETFKKAGWEVLPLFLRAVVIKTMTLVLLTKLLALLRYDIMQKANWGSLSPPFWPRGTSYMRRSRYFSPYFSIHMLIWFRFAGWQVCAAKPLKPW